MRRPEQRMTQEHAALQGMRRIILETDAAVIARALNDNFFDLCLQMC